MKHRFSIRLAALALSVATALASDGKPATEPSSAKPAAELSEAITLAAGYLVGACDEDGKFLYEVNLNPSVLVGDRYNILRHAGAIYALGMFIEFQPEPEAIEASLRAVKFLKERTLGPVPGHDDLLAFWTRPDLTRRQAPVCAKLGGAGLGLLALLSAEKHSPGFTSMATLRKIGDFILFMQKRNGGFHSKHIPSTGGRDDAWTSLYYPGEAALGLMALHDIDPDPKWLKGAVNALLHLAEKRKGKHRVEPDHWALLATAKVLDPVLKTNRKLPKEPLLRHARQICQSILADKTHLPPDDAEKSPPDLSAIQLCSAATRLEGLSAALTFLPDADASLKEAIQSKIDAAVPLLLKAQIKTGEYAGGFPRSWTPLYGNPLPRSLKFTQSSTGIRIDYPQHALSALIQIHKLTPSRRQSHEHRLKTSAIGPFTSYHDHVEKDAFPAWLKRQADNLPWRPPANPASLNESVVRVSRNLCEDFLVNNQLPAGNFRYQSNFVTGSPSREDGQTRQAGALWGAAAALRRHGNPALLPVVEKGLNFFLKHSRFMNDATEPPRRLIAYPRAETCDTGAVALVALAIIETLRASQEGTIPLAPERGRTLASALDGFLNHLVFTRRGDGHFADAFSLVDGAKSDTFSPYFDGEALLCLTAAARHAGHRELIPLIEETAAELAYFYTIKEWNRDVDSDLTKGFYQWSCMAFAEYANAGWKNADHFVNTMICATWWMIHVHRLLERTGNTAYAFEGIIPTLTTAGDRNADMAAVLRDVTARGLGELISWQVGGPLAKDNRFLRRNPTCEPIAVGGVMNATASPILRIDVTQHQLHALSMALDAMNQKSAEE